MPKICESCGKQFSSGQRLQYHVDNNVCKKSLYQCQLCGRDFSCKNRLVYHTEHGVCQKKQKIVLKVKPISSSCEYDSLSREELIERLKRNEIENRVLKEYPQIVNNNINVVINFGQEKIDDILKKSPNLLRETITKHLMSSVPFLTKHIHCNPDLPEYRNVYIKSFNNPYAMIYNGGQFCRQDKTLVIGQLIDQCLQFIGNHVEELDNQKLTEKYERYRDSVDTDGKRRKELEKELIGILIDQNDQFKLDIQSKMLLIDYIKESDHILSV
jgi:hypothetical protein